MVLVNWRIISSRSPVEIASSQISTKRLEDNNLNRSSNDLTASFAIFVRAYVTFHIHWYSINVKIPICFLLIKHPVPCFTPLSLSHCFCVWLDKRSRWILGSEHSMDSLRFLRILLVSASILLVSLLYTVTAGDIVHQDDLAPKKPGCENDFVLVLFLLPIQPLSLWLISKIP